MGRILDALQRQQENQGQENDPLAEKMMTPEQVVDDTPGFELPDRIGSPMGPRSNEGAAITFFSEEDLARSTPGLPDYSNGVFAPPVNKSGTNGERSLNGIAGLVPVNKITAPVPGERGSHTPTTIEPYVPTTADLDISRLHTRLVLFTDPQSEGCEQYRTLRTQVFHAAEKKLTQVILMTSAVAGEGKTSTILNLAWAIAQSKEKRVLVIDSDLRRPSISSYLGLDFELGFGEVLNGVSAALPAIVRIADSSLYILSSTREEPNPAELLSKERVGETLSELRRHFDYILIDAPPTVAFADARLLANHADAIVMVVRAGLAGHSTIERAMEALPTNRILGVVLNGADQMSEVGYYGYYGYGYGYGYRKNKEQSSWLERMGLGLLAERFKRRKDLPAENNTGTSSDEEK